MTFKLYLELASRAQDSRILDLLRLPSARVTVGGEWSARWWSHGKNTRMRSPDREALISKIAERGINELELKWKGTGAAKSGAHLNLLGLWIPTFTPGVTSGLWAAVPEASVKSREDERTRRQFSGRKPGKEEGRRQPDLSIIEYSLEFSTGSENPSDSELQKRCVGWIREALPDDFGLPDLIGYGCVHETCRRMNMVANLGGVGPWEDQLGGRFENIYPILIGRLGLCEGLKEVLGERGSLAQIAGGMGIISIDPHRVQEIREDPRVRDYVVLRDLSMLPYSSEALDEVYRNNRQIPAVAPFFKR